MSPVATTPLVIGTGGPQLTGVQANAARDALGRAGRSPETIVAEMIRASGDRIQDRRDGGKVCETREAAQQIDCETLGREKALAVKARRPAAFFGV